MKSNGILAETAADYACAAETTSNKPRANTTERNTFIKASSELIFFELRTRDGDSYPDQQAREIPDAKQEDRVF